MRVTAIHTRYTSFFSKEKPSRYQQGLTKLTSLKKNGPTEIKRSIELRSIKIGMLVRLSKPSAEYDIQGIITKVINDPRPDINTVAYVLWDDNSTGMYTLKQLRII
jgi:hypothetical protein